MTTSPELIYDMIDREPVWFERQVLSRLALDNKFASTVGHVLFKDHEDHDARSFQMPRHIGMAKAVMLYHSHGAPAGTLSVEFMQACMSSLAQSGQLPINDLNDVWQQFYQMVSDSHQSWGMVVAQTNIGCTYWLKQVRSRAITSRAASEGWRADVLSSSLRLENAFIDKITRVSKIRHDMWELLATPMPDTIRLKTSIQSLNVRLAGGFGLGESYLVIAASGVGKSVVASQFSAEWCCQGKKGVYITTERTQSGHELMRRIFSQQCRIPYKQIVNGINQQALQPSQQQAMDQLKGMMNRSNFQFIHWYDKPDTGNLEAMRDEIMQAADEMGGMDFITLDWIGGALAQKFSNDKDKLRLLFKSAADMTAQMAADINVVALVTAQAHEKKGKDTARVDTSCLAECTSMGQEMTGVIGLSGIRDKTEGADGHSDNYVREQYLYISKARKGEGGLVPVTRRFEYQKLTDRLAN